MLSYLKFMIVTAHHKWCVFRAGRELRVPLWRLLKHDWSKFSPSELPYYARKYCGDGMVTPQEWDAAWRHHVKFNDHHPEHWLSEFGYAMPMEPEAAAEMVADWIGAATAYTGKPPESLDSWYWYKKNYASLPLHPDTRRIVDECLDWYFTHK